MKKVANRDCLGEVSGASGSVPANGDATKVPISRREMRSLWSGSITVVTSELDVAVGS